MDPTLEIALMPAPQWLFGNDISEDKRLRFVRLYFQHIRLRIHGRLHEQTRASLEMFLDRCGSVELTLAVPRDLAIEILRDPEQFGYGVLRGGTSVWMRG